MSGYVAPVRVDVASMLPSVGFDQVVAIQGGRMTAGPIRLKRLLRERHWQKYSTFCREYDRTAVSVDPDLVGGAPSRGQLHRWLAGDLKGLPYPDHCRVLEAMFPGWTAASLFEIEEPAFPGSAPSVDGLVQAVSDALQAPDAQRTPWRTGRAEPTSGSATGLDGAVSSADQPVPAPMQRIAKKLVALARVRRLDDAETARLASLAGHVVELAMDVEIEIDADGHGCVTYRHELLNLSDEEVSRLPREVWFEHTPRPLAIEPLETGSRHVHIRRLHDAQGLAKFACEIVPPIQPGESGMVAYRCTGGQFISDHYWRQGAARFTRHLTITLRHRAVAKLLSYSAVEEHSTGTEVSVSDEIVWDNEGADALVTLTRDYLSPGQTLTLRWDVEHIERTPDPTEKGSCDAQSV
ncbi:hypothetical protein [Nocardia farcinica]|uniref:hypothetical protein n=1 Tax=Nocardia farcinica TaxID=37329 RepID=UPI001E65B76C|nr:hypothetical protein [Nocardia farcinica]